jgi:tetratricopeptide (TPR) repeat protein
MSIACSCSKELEAACRTLISIGVLLSTIPAAIMAQGDPLGMSNPSAVEQHFSAAQQAEKSGDYPTAEREYRAVLAIRPAFAEVHMNLGLVYQLQDRIPDAMTEFRRALKLKPTLAGANFFLGVDFCKLGNGKEAIPYLKSAAREAPERPDIWSWLASAQESAGEIHAEVVTLRKALTRHSNDVDLLYQLGRAYEQLGKEEATSLQRAAPGSFRAEQLLAESYAVSSNWPTGIIHFQNALKTSPGALGLHVELGELLLHAGKLKAAAREFEEELRLDPHNFRAIVRRGEMELIAGDLDAALRDWAQAVETDSVRAKQILGIRETGFGDAAFEQLSESWRREIERHATQLQHLKTPAAHLALDFLAAQHGEASLPGNQEGPPSSHDSEPRASSPCSESEVQQALQTGRFSQAKLCAVHLAKPTASATFRLKVAGALFDDGDYEATLNVLEAFARGEGHAPEIFYWRARSYEKLATEAYLRLCRADPNSYRVHQLVADLNETKGDDRKAIEEYRAAIAFKPSVSNLHYSLGHVLWKDLKLNDAREQFEAELALNPRHAGALIELGDTYLLEHQPDKALPYLTRALAMDPGNLDLHRDLGTAYSELGDYRKAVSEFRIASPNDHDGSVHYKLARAYTSLGEKDKAKQEFEISTALNREAHDKLEKQTERLSEVEKSFQDPR